jgi:NADH-quinone oxidoreductase subunit M
LIGVFLANDALVFYIFWELALIPVYFLSSLFGGENRIKVTFKFFVYTFVGSLLLLVAFLIIYNHTTDHSFAWTSFVESGKSMSGSMQNWMFWLVFLAFAIKMPMFPFHTWQPDAYEQSATPVTIVLSAIMVKMGLFAVIKWLLPVLPLGVLHWTHLVTILSIIGIIYASCLAIVQTNIKRLIAYSSIAHIGLMIATLFAQNQLGTQGVAIQMFNHGINIMGLWLLVLAIEKRLGTQNLNEMGGLAKLAPKFTIALVLISLANIALPLTNGFIGEFMMFNGLFQSTSQYHIVFTIIAGLGVILAAVYTLGMIQKIAFGELKNNEVVFADLSTNEWIVLMIIMGIILWLGFCPNVLMSLVS